MNDTNYSNMISGLDQGDNSAILMSHYIELTANEKTQLSGYFSDILDYNGEFISDATGNELKKIYLLDAKLYPGIIIDNSREVPPFALITYKDSSGSGLKI